MCTREGRRTPFAPTLCTPVPHRLALLPSSLLHTQRVSQALGPGRNSLGSVFSYLRPQGYHTGEQLLFLVFLSFDQDIRIFTLEKIKTTPPKLKSQIKIPNTVTNLRFSFWSPRDSGVTPLSWCRGPSEDRGRQHWLCPTKLISPVSCCGSLQKAFKFLFSFLIDHQ